MALNKTLNATCNLDRYLFCRMPAEALEVEIQVKTKWGKFSMFQDTYTRTEKYLAWDRADWRSSVRNRRRRTPHREVRSSHEENNTTSETDVPIGQGLRYPPQVFTDAECAATVPQTEEEEEGVSNNEFLGKYCDLCEKGGETYCWCNSSDWEEGLLNVEQPNAHTNPSIEKTPSPTIRKPPAGWAKQRCRVVQAARENRQNMEIEQARSLSPEEFNTNSNNSK